MSQAEIGNLRVRLGIDTAQFANGVKAAQSSLAGLAGSLKTLAVGAAAGAAGALGALAFAMSRSITRMDELGKAAQKIGIPVDELSKLEYAARLSDVSLESLTTTLARFSRSVSEISAGGENDAGAALAAIGVSATDAEGRLRPTSAILMDVADKFAGMRDSANKTALAIALFGKSGADMIPLLNGGRQAIAAAGPELEQFGGVVTPEAARQAEEFNDNLTRLQTASEGLTREVGRYLLPPLIQLTEKLLELVKTGPSVEQWLSWITPFFTELGNRIATTRRELDLILDGLRYIGVLDPKPLEIDIPGGDLPYTPPAPPPKTDAPALPSPQNVVPPGTLDDIYGTGEAVNALEEAFKGATPEAGLFSDTLLSLGDTIKMGLSDALAGLINGTMSVQDAFKSMAQSIIQTLTDLAAQLAVNAGLKILLAALGGGGGAGFNIGGMTFGGIYGDGGYLGAGQWGIAGERGPEIIHGPARITPMDKMGGGGPMNVTVNNYAGAEVRTRQTPDGMHLDILKAEIAKDLARGGNIISQAVERGYGLRRAGR